MNRYLFFIVCTFLSISLLAQNDDVLMTIGDNKVTKSEFVRIYQKNNSQESAQKSSIDEYLQLFINFKLKVIEAEKLKMDTATAFKTELATYRKQLARPYFTDNKVIDNLVKEAYQRIQTEIRVFHILINVDISATGNDSIMAFNKAMKIRKRLLSGEDFSTVARETSDDPSASSNGGDLWYLTALRTPYNFESYVYNAKLNEVSMPLRTSYGYHLIKVTEKRKALGQVKVAHIMVAVPQGTDSADVKKAKEKIFEIHKKIKENQDFAKLAEEFSDDKGTSKNGGALEWFSSGRMVVEFERAAFSLQKNGDISEPVRTAYGWHILKRIDRKEIPTFEQMQNDIKTMITNDQRSELAKTSVIETLKKEYKFQQLASVSDFYKAVDSTIFEGKWTMDKASNLTNPFFSFGNKTYNQSDFTNYLNKQQHASRKLSVSSHVDLMYKTYVDELVADYEEEQLDKKYPEFNLLMKEYHDGILLFGLSDKMVWSKAEKDTVGLKDYYNKTKTNYMTTEQIGLSIFSCPDENIQKSAMKAFEKKTKKNLLNPEVVKLVDNSAFTLLKSAAYSKGANDTINLIFDKFSKNEITKDEKVVYIPQKKIIVYIDKRVAPQPKPFIDVKGLIIADYQNYLDTEWLKALKAKYQVSIDDKVLSSIKSSIK